MSEHYDRVVASLPHLEPAERVRVLERLKALSGLAPAETLAAATGAFEDTGARPAHDEVLDVIAAVVLRRAGERQAPAALRRAAQFRAFAPKAADLYAFAARHAPTRAARRALLELGFDLLYQDLAAAEFAVTARLLMQCAHQVPSVLDNAFPGYARAGLLGMVVGSGKGAL